MQIVMTVTLDADDVAEGLPAALRKLAGVYTEASDCGSTTVRLALPEAVNTFDAGAIAAAGASHSHVQTAESTPVTVAPTLATVPDQFAAPASLPIPAEASKILNLELDSAYTPWVEGIHNSNKKFYASGPNIGLWMLGRGIDRDAAEPQLRARREQIKAALTSPQVADYALAPVTPASTPMPDETLPPFAAASPATVTTDAPVFAAQSPQDAAPFAALAAAPTAPVQDWTWPEFLQAMSRCGVTAVQVQEASGLPNFAALASDGAMRATVAAKLNMTKVGV